ncbi:efflux RND transporter periplasmic adaptor subunit [bacterium]|nr:efflux RND transporter periplasmic adaptor subunit [bacterium]
MGRFIRWLVILAIVGGACAFGYKQFKSRADGDRPNYMTSPIRRSDLVSFIPATGTIEPEDLIDVGAQVAGRIIEFGKDEDGKEIDYGSRLKKGMILARIDDSTYKSQLKMSEASLNSAKANLARSEADMGQLKAKLNQAQRDWERAQRLGPSDALAQSSYDAYKSAYESAQANLEVGKAAIKQAEAQVTQSQAQLDLARQNMGYCTILSPVDGVIIDRRVNIGQTVVASLNAPSLFLIAKDLRQVQIWVAVNEADIGSIHVGQPVTFKVSALPNEQFHGKVGKIRLNASMTQNVVTYTVEVLTDNSDGRLLPYLTADVQFETARADEALVIPNAALRWTPPATAQVASADNTTSATARRPRGGAGREGRQAGQRQGGAGSSSGRAGGGRGGSIGTIWTLENDQLKPVRVRVGITDGIDTAVSGREVAEGMNVVTGIQMVQAASTAGSTGGASPFVPQIPRRGGSGGGGRGGSSGGGGR